MVTHVIDPEHFHCQLKKFATHLDEIMQSLEDHCKKLGPNDDCIGDIRLGQPCLAKFSADNSWYRAKVTGLLQGIHRPTYFENNWEFTIIVLVLEFDHLENESKI